MSEAESIFRLALSGIEWDQCDGGEQEETAVLGPHVDRRCQGRGGSLCNPRTLRWEGGVPLPWDVSVLKMLVS